MSQFPWAAYSRWQEPPNSHEICACENCHHNDEHYIDREDWAKLCVHCASDLVEAAELALDER